MEGDEFAVILESMTDARRDTRLVAEKILEMLSKPVTLNRAVVSISASIGTTLYLADIALTR